jgi:tRNA(Ile)-lysidine synthase
MLSELQQHLSNNFPFLNEKKLLLAVSGGLDSMVLASLCHQLSLQIGIAHCNFQLRVEESDADADFVKNFADKNNIPFFLTRFDTQSFAKDYQLSTQVAARELRYQWFYELLEQENFDYILTAHHADDNLETFIINFSRGTGLNGLTGIPSQNNKIIRPLLSFSRKEIETYANANEIQWREDSSNLSDKYLRNKVRHRIVPVLKDLNPGFLSAFETTLQQLQQSQSLVNDAAIMVYQQVVTEESNQKNIDLDKLKVLPNYKAYLYQWLQPFGFKAWNDIYDLVESQSGKQVFSTGFRLLKDRSHLILSPLEIKDATEYWIQENQMQVNFPLKLSFSKVSDISDVSNTTIFVDEKKLAFPLVIRKPKTGDFFQPLGMNGLSKKISKFFKDEKLSLVEKEKVWLLCSKNEIIWVIGMRQDERFKTENTTQNILQITLL